MCPHPAAADTIRTLIAAVPDDRLRELFLEFALAALAVPAVEEPKPAPRNGRLRGTTISTRSTPNAARSDGRPRSHTSPPATPPSAAVANRRKNNGAGAHGNGATVSAEALWEHARKLEPRQPWRAVSRELGISEGATQLALRNLTVSEDVSPAARFLTL
jgi:hypothetical protein